MSNDQALFSGRGLWCVKAQQLCYIGWPEEVHVKLDALAELCAGLREKNSDRKNKRRKRFITM